MPSNLENRLAQAAQCTAESSKIQKSNNHDGIGRIFIVGVPRCGSTLLETILANHPSIFELGETEALKVAVKRVYETGSKEEPMSLSDAYEAELSSDARKSTFTVDKNLYNYLRVGYIAKAMPAAKIIHCCRNPLDNILSMLRSNLRSGNDYTSDPIEAAKLIINHQKLMNSNKIDFPDQVFTFNYDEFTASPEVMIKPLIDWLGVEWNDDYLSPEQNKRVVTTLASFKCGSLLATNQLVDGRIIKNYFSPRKECWRKVVYTILMNRHKSESSFFDPYNFGFYIESHLNIITFQAPSSSRNTASPDL